MERSDRGRTCRILRLDLLLVLACSALVTTSAAPQERDAGGEVTWAEHVAPIVYEHCSHCHRPGGGTPFPLTTYQQARERGRLLSMVAKDGFMPPYPPTVDSPAFSNLAPMSDAEVDLLARWVSGGSKPGDEQSAPAPPDPEVWELGEPDLVLEASEELEVPLDAFDVLRNFVLPLPVDEPRWLRAVALWPGGARPQRALFWVASAGAAETVAPDDPGSVGGLQPGLGFGPPPAFGGELLTTPAAPYPADAGRLVEPGEVLVLQAVFQGTGEAYTARPRVGLYFAESSPARRLVTVPVGASDFTLAAGEVTIIERSFELPVAARVEGVLPFAHRLATELRGWATTPAGERHTLIEIDEWDVAWLSPYWLAEPIDLPAGSTLGVEIVYDNTEDNFSQVHFPPRDVGPGLSPSREIAALDVMLTVAPDDLAGLEQAWTAHRER
ncbi:MAG TPA: cytochrome c [Thermoanaerobaculia bacterium]|nr:cytochrome c [Thermoanaerobaculia bacterium]